MVWDLDLNKLMALCFKMIESQNGKYIQPGDEWKNDAQSIAIKIFRHVASVQQISSGMSFNFGITERFSHIDHSSVAIITRATFEAYLAFKYIFINADENTSIFRHKVWRLAGLKDRSKLYSNSTETRKILEDEAISIDALTNEISESQLFIVLNRDAKREILKGNWKPKGGWNALGVNANIHKIYFDDIYNHLSGHSHASYISAIQIRDAASIEDQKNLANAPRQMLCLIMAHLLFSYAQLFPDASIILRSDQELYDIANSWNIQKENVDFIYDKHTQPQII